MVMVPLTVLALASKSYQPEAPSNVENLPVPPSRHRTAPAAAGRTKLPRRKRRKALGRRRRRQQRRRSQTTAMTMVRFCVALRCGACLPSCLQRLHSPSRPAAAAPPPGFEGTVPGVAAGGDAEEVQQQLAGVKVGEGASCHIVGPFLLGVRGMKCVCVLRLPASNVWVQEGLLARLQ